MFKYTIKSKVYGDAILNECVSSASVKPGYLVELATVYPKAVIPFPFPLRSRRIAASAISALLSITIRPR